MNEIKDNIFGEAYKALTEGRLVIILGDENLRKDYFKKFATDCTLKSGRFLFVNHDDVLPELRLFQEIVRMEHNLQVGYCNLLAKEAIRFTVEKHTSQEAILALDGLENLEKISYFDRALNYGIFAIFSTQWDEDVSNQKGVESFIGRYNGYISAKTLQLAFVMVVSSDAIPVAYTSFDFLDKFI